MSFTDISKRFKAAGWKRTASRNKIEEVVEDIIHHADDAIAKAEGFLDSQAAAQGRADRATRHFADLRERLRRHVSRMFSLTRLRHALNEPAAIATRVADHLLEQLSDAGLSLEPISSDEKWETTAGYATFAEYVLQPPSFERFFGEMPPIELGPDRLAALVQYFTDFTVDRKRSKFSEDSLNRIAGLFDRSHLFPPGMATDVERLASSLSKDSSISPIPLAKRIIVDLEQLIEDRELALSTQKSERSLRATMAGLMKELVPGKKDRKVRPYEVFLYAAQNRILTDQLVRPRNALSAGFIPHPRHWTYLPILIHHKGHPFENLGDSEEPGSGS